MMMAPPSRSGVSWPPLQLDSSLSQQAHSEAQEIPQQSTTLFPARDDGLPQSMARPSFPRTVQSSTQQPSAQRYPPPAPPVHSQHSTTQPAPASTASPFRPRKSHSLPAPCPPRTTPPSHRMKWLASTQQPFPQRTPRPVESVTVSS